VQLVGVANVPRPHGRAAVFSLRLANCGELGSLGIEGVSVVVFWASDGRLRLRGIGGKDGVLGAVDVGVYA